ncbi:hypothetical protein K438DRAFT_672044 [Mycena galopus ATCC 62051]|nr:hypothetical protein K438DRAFT_672044 [Mycena galopus ATCC 62051]
MVMDLGEASFADIMMPMRRSALSYGTELLHALHGLHAQGIVHLDVKPANLVLGKDGELLVMTMGSPEGSTWRSRRSPTSLSGVGSAEKETVDSRCSGPPPRIHTCSMSAVGHRATFHRLCY